MPDFAGTWTRDAVLALPDDGNRYELVDGRLLVTPAPRLAHQLAITELLAVVDPYVRAHRLGTVLLAPADLDLRSGQVVQPDLFVAGPVNGRRPAEWADVGVPLLVAEVLSPATARHDRVTKRRRYQRSGVPACWVIHLDARMVEVWTPAHDLPAIVDDDLLWAPDPDLPELNIDLPAYFDRIWHG